MSVMVDGTSAKCTLSNKGEKKLSIDACELKYRVLKKKKKKTTFDEWGYAFTVRGLRGGSKTTRMQDLKRLADSKNEIESALREMTLFDMEMDSKIVCIIGLWRSLPHFFITDEFERGLKEFSLYHSLIL